MNIVRADGKYPFARIFFAGITSFERGVIFYNCHWGKIDIAVLLFVVV